MLLSNGILTNEVLRWKAIGAAVWLAAITVAMSAAWSLAAAPTTLLSPLRLLSGLFSPSGWLAAAALVLAQAPAFVAQVGALQGSDPKPSHALRLPRLGAAAVVVSKLAARCSSALGAARTTSFLGLHVLSAMMFLGIDSATRSAAPQGATWTLLYGLWLAGLYLLHWAYWSQDVLLFPAVQRHRYFRLKARAPGAAAQAARLAALAFVGAAATAALRAQATGGAAGGAVNPAAGGAWPLTLGGSAAALLAGGLCAFGWLMGAAAVEVVFSERLRPDDYSDRDVLGAMSACLAGKRGELMQALALHDVSKLASDVGKAGARRRDIFADEAGDRWKPVAAACISELDTLSTAVAAAAPQQKPAAPGPGPAGGAASAATQQSRHKWNVLPSALSSKGGLSGSRQQVEALLAARSAYPRAALAVQALAGFAAASLKEDRFGVLQLTQPGLGEVLLSLLGALGAAQQLQRSAASLAPRQLALGPWRGDGDAAPSSGVYASQTPEAAPFALADVLTVALYRLAAAFGPGLTKVLAECKAAPAYGTPAEAAALLQQILKGSA